MSNIKASTLRNRSANTENAMDKVNAKILSGNMIAEVTYEVVNGMKVRMPNAAIPVTREDSFDLLNRNRAVSVDEILEAVGTGVMNYLIKKGFIRQNGNTSIYYVTVEAQKHYKLSAPRIGRYFK